MHTVLKITAIETGGLYYHLYKSRDLYKRPINATIQAEWIITGVSRASGTFLFLWMILQPGYSLSNS